MKLKRSKIFIYSVFFIFFLILPQKIGEHHRWQRYCDWIIANSAMAEQHLIEKPFRLSNEMKGSSMECPKLKTKLKHLLISRKKMKLICFFSQFTKKENLSSAETKLAETKSEVWRHRIYEYVCVNKYITCSARFFIYENVCVCVCVCDG